MMFLLGTHKPNWLWEIDVPLFVSQRALARRKSYKPSLGPWALDSGGFSELSLLGHWETSPQQYISAVHHYQQEIGNLLWAAPQDWMCEPMVLAKTGLTIEEHQRRTVASFLTLEDAGVPVIPVIQGFEDDDYDRCIDLYTSNGVDLTTKPLVGVGSVCRRQNTPEIARLLHRLAGLGLNIHGFGVKITGLKVVSKSLTSADSLSWSYQARMKPALPGCVGHKNCANCVKYALRWRDHVLSIIASRS